MVGCKLVLAWHILGTMHFFIHPTSIIHPASSTATAGHRALPSMATSYSLPSGPGCAPLCPPGLAHPVPNPVPLVPLTWT